MHLWKPLKILKLDQELELFTDSKIQYPNLICSIQMFIPKVPQNHMRRCQQIALIRWSGSDRAQTVVSYPIPVHSFFILFLLWNRFLHRQKIITYGLSYSWLRAYPRIGCIREHQQPTSAPHTIAIEDTKTGFLFYFAGTRCVEVFWYHLADTMRALRIKLSELVSTISGHQLNLIELLLIYDVWCMMRVCCSQALEKSMLIADHKRIYSITFIKLAIRRNGFLHSDLHRSLLLYIKSYEFSFFFFILANQHLDDYRSMCSSICMCKTLLDTRDACATCQQRGLPALSSTRAWGDR